MQGSAETSQLGASHKALPLFVDSTHEQPILRFLVYVTPSIGRSPSTIELLTASAQEHPA